jgi:hypothetical protein
MPIVASAEVDAAFITGAVAALAIVGSLVTTALTLRHQRALADEERISNRRADAYIRLLEHQRVDPSFKDILPPEVASRLLAYGSEEANHALDAVRASRGQPPPAFSDAIDVMVRQIRLELQGKPDRGSLHAVARWQT